MFHWTFRHWTFRHWAFLIGRFSSDISHWTFSHWTFILRSLPFDVYRWTFLDGRFSLDVSRKAQEIRCRPCKVWHCWSGDIVALIPARRRTSASPKCRECRWSPQGRRRRPGVGFDVLMFTGQKGWSRAQKKQQNHECGRLSHERLPLWLRTVRLGRWDTSG